MKDLLVEDVAPIYEKPLLSKCDDIPSDFDLAFDFGERWQDAVQNIYSV